MKKNEKKTKTNALKRPYSKPQLEQVRLIAEEAVLTACKAVSDPAPQGGPNNDQSCTIGGTQDLLCFVAGT